LYKREYQALPLLVAILFVELEDTTLSISFIKAPLLFNKIWFLGPILDRSSPEIYVNNITIIIRSHNSITNNPLRILV